MEFCSSFLQFIAHEMDGIDSPYDVFRFDYDPTKSEYIHMKTYKNRNEFSFLPEWFIAEVESLKNE